MVKKTQKNRIFSRIICFFAAFSFLTTAVFPPSYAQSILSLPQVGSMVSPGPAFAPPVLRGMRLHPDNPFRFDFIIDTGQNAVQEQELKDEATHLIKYFLASLTVPEKDLWVNLSPYEENRIIPTAFGITEMGRDLLAQDYILKQLTASLMYPEDEAGRQFWNKVRQEVAQKTGNSDIPMDTFNKVWIVPDHAQVYVNGQTVFIVESRLKVMLETDYLAMKSEQKDAQSLDNNQNAMKQALRETIIPIIEKEVNEGEHFAQLRQIYHSMILSTWFKRNLQKTLLGEIYMEQNKISGIDVTDKEIKDKIYQQYLEAFKAGVFNYIKEEYDPVSQQVIPRKYFSGGFWGFDGADASALTSSNVSEEQMSAAAQTASDGPLAVASTGMDMVAKGVAVGVQEDSDTSMLSEGMERTIVHAFGEEFVQEHEQELISLDRILEDYGTHYLSMSLDLFNGVFRTESERNPAKKYWSKIYELMIAMDGPLAPVLMDALVYFVQVIKDENDIERIGRQIVAGVRRMSYERKLAFLREGIRNCRQALGEDIFFAHWDQIADAVEVLGEEAPMFLAQEIFTLRSSIGKDFFEAHLKQILELAAALGPEVGKLYRNSFPSFIEAFGRDFFVNHFDTLAELAQAAKGSVIHVFDGLETFKGMIKDGQSLRQIGERLIELAQAAGEEAEVIFDHGLPAAAGLIHDAESLRQVGGRLIELAQGAGENAENVFHALKIVKDEQSLRPVGERLLKLVQEAGENAEAVFNYGFPAVGGAIHDTESVNRVGRRLINLAEAAGQHKEIILRALNAFSDNIHNINDIERFAEKLLELRKATETIDPKGNIFDLAKVFTDTGSIDQLREDVLYWNEFYQQGLKDLLQYAWKHPQMVFDILESRTAAYGVVLDDYNGVSQKTSDHMKELFSEKGKHIDLRWRMKVMEDLSVLYSVRDFAQKEKTSEFSQVFQEQFSAVSQDAEDMLSEDANHRSIAGKIHKRTQSVLQSFFYFNLGRELSERDQRFLLEQGVEKAIITIMRIVATRSASEKAQRLANAVFNLMMDNYDPTQDNAVERAVYVTSQQVMGLVPLAEDAVYGQEIREAAQKNKAEIERLQARGSDARLWTEGIDFEMVLDKGVTPEGKKAEIRQVAYEMVEIAQKNGIDEIEIEGRVINLETADHLDNKDVAAKYYEALMAMEEENELHEEDVDRMEDLLEQVKNIDARVVMDVEKERFRVKIRKNVLEEMTAGYGVPGCFAPNGIRREMPFIHALEANSFFIQIFTRDGKQVSNAVVLLGDDGAYMEPAYTSGGYDMTAAYGRMLARLSKYVPGVIFENATPGKLAVDHWLETDNVPQKFLKRSLVFKNQYFDRGEPDEDGLTVSFTSPQILRWANIPEAERERLKQEAAPQAAIDRTSAETAPAVDTEVRETIDWQAFADTMIENGLQEYLFMIKPLKQKIAREGRFAVDDEFYLWAVDLIKARVGEENFNVVEAEALVDQMLDFVEAQDGLWVENLTADALRTEDDFDQGADASMSAGGIWVDGVRQRGDLPFELTPQETTYVRLLRRNGVNVVFYTNHDNWQDYLRDHGYDSKVSAITLPGRTGRKDQVLVHKGRQQKVPLHVALSHEAVHIKHRRTGRYEENYYRIRDALWDLEDEGDERGLDLFKKITYQLQYRHTEENRILNDWQVGTISRKEAIDRIQKRYGEQDPDYVDWLRTAPARQIFEEYGIEVEEIADEFFSYVYSQLILTPRERKALVRKDGTQDRDRLVAEFIEHVEGTRVFEMLQSYYEGIGMPAVVGSDSAMLLRKEDISRLAPVEGDEIFIRNESGMPVPYEVLSVQQDAENQHIFHLTLLDPMTGQDINRDYDLVKKLSELKLVNSQVLEDFELIETPVAGVLWKQYTNRVYKALSDKNHPDVREDQKWRLYLRPGSVSAMETLVEAVKETAQGFDGPVEFKYISENEPSLEEKLADPNASRFVINFASQQDALAFYEALKAHQLYNVAMGVGETLAAERLDALTSVAQGHTAVRTGDASVLSFRKEQEAALPEVLAAESRDEEKWLIIQELFQGDVVAAVPMLRDVLENKKSPLEVKQSAANMLEWIGLEDFRSVSREDERRELLDVQNHLIELGVRKGHKVVNVGSGANYYFSMATATLGAYIVNYDLDSLRHETVRDRIQSLVRHSDISFDGSYVFKGEFSNDFNADSRDIPDNSVDFIIINSVFDDPDFPGEDTAVSIIVEASRVAREKGKIVISSYSELHNKIAGEIWEAAIQDDEIRERFRFHSHLMRKEYLKNFSLLGIFEVEDFHLTQASELSQDAPVGGIDLTPDQMFLQETGGTIDFDAALDPAVIEQLRGVEIEGLAPVIFNIQPITNVPLFFSQNKDDQPQRLAAILP